MFDFQNFDWTTIIYTIIAILVGGFAFRIVIKRNTKKDKSRKTFQLFNKVGGDQIGGDKNKK